MPKEPEQVLPQKWRASIVLNQIRAGTKSARWEAGLPSKIQAAGNEKTGSEIAIHQEQDTRGEQHAERQQPKNCSDEPCPASQGHAHHGHAFGPHVENGSDEV